MKRNEGINMDYNNRDDGDDRNGRNGNTKTILALFVVVVLIAGVVMWGSRDNNNLNNITPAAGNSQIENNTNHNSNRY
jgi:hypothetical protein